MTEGSMSPGEALELAKHHNIVLDASLQKGRAAEVDTGGTTPRGRRVTQVCCQSILSCVASPETSQRVTSTQAQSPLILSAASNGPIPCRALIRLKSVPSCHHSE